MLSWILGIIANLTLALLRRGFEERKSEKLKTCVRARERKENTEN